MFRWIDLMRHACFLWYDLDTCVNLTLWDMNTLLSHNKDIKSFKFLTICTEWWSWWCGTTSSSLVGSPGSLFLSLLRHPDQIIITLCQFHPTCSCELTSIWLCLALLLPSTIPSNSSSVCLHSCLRMWPKYFSWYVGLPKMLKTNPFDLRCT